MFELPVNPRIVLMPPLHIKLGLMKQFAKALNQESTAFKFLEFLRKLSAAKIKCGIFAGPQIKVIKSTEFPISSVGLREQHGTISRQLLKASWAELKTTSNLCRII